MKRFFQRKSGATYFGNYPYTIAIRKDYVEFYKQLDNHWHAVINVEIYEDFVVLVVECGDFANQLFEHILPQGINIKADTPLGKLLTDEQYKIVVDKTGKTPTTKIIYEIEKHYQNFLAALGSPEVLEAFAQTFQLFISLHNQLLHSPEPSLQTLRHTLYD